ncbi:uncharacterized protein LOC111080155 isoform X2 [Drosophila obscura]|uniref:uncharacterized protein LOC111080155 isoform X2 n=1 Tax=Drosophila obscura TaxID=7282 RepID=UPI001BB1F6E9|nr:uncharacterized protein LOC111080155 isoform X2 [Drosophila obscura]
MSTAEVDADLESCALLNASDTTVDPGRTRSKQRVSLNSKRRRSRMSRRANLIGICGVGSLCILLLIATTQHRPLTTPFNQGSGGGPAAAAAAAALSQAAAYGVDGGPSNSLGRNSFYERLQQQMQQQQPSQTVVYNLTATIVDVLSAQRSRILTEMENFEYPRGGAERLSDMTPATNGTPVRSVVVTSWRSGSTFLGDILNSIPGNYYHYEPLLDFGIKQVRDPDDQDLAVQNLKNLLNCDYADMTDYLNFGKTHTYLFEHNTRLWDVCREYPRFCWRPTFLTRFCRLFPIQSMKTVRLRLAQAEKLLEDQRYGNQNDHETSLRLKICMESVC